MPIIVRSSKPVQALRVVGISPENRFLEISKWMIVFKLPTFGGIEPLKRLSERPRRIERVVISRSCGDEVPVSLLLETFKSIKFLQLPKDDGMLPCKLLNPNQRLFNTDRCPRESGIIP